MGNIKNDDQGLFQFQNRPYYPLILIVCLLLVFTVRFNYAKYLPLSGDEVGVGVLQSVGKWSLYKNTLPCNEKVDVFTIKKYLEYSNEYSSNDVLSTMRSDRLHPPLYFILLHFVIKYFGTTVAVLRMLSIIFSVFSVITFYYLGKVLYNDSVGLISALLMSLSAYCLEYSVMVRMYPLAMWLALLSTLLAVILVKRDAFHFRSILLYIYIFISVAGLYTYYSFAVLIASQFVFVLLSNKKDLKALTNIFFAYFLIIILLIPWILTMIEGVHYVHTKNYYFTGSYTLLFLLQYFFETIFIPFKSQLFSFSPIFVNLGISLLSLFILFIYLVGVFKSAYSRTIISFLFSVFIYFLILVVSDKLLYTKTMVFDRQHYFAIPVLLLLLASGVVHLSKNMYVKRTIIFLLTIVFVSGLIYRYHNKSVFDGPYYFQQLTQQLNNYSLNTTDKENLILYNAKDKRYLLPFIHNTSRNFDLMIIPEGINDSILKRIGHIEKYRNIFLVNINVPAIKRERLKLQNIDLNIVSLYLSSNGFINDTTPYIYNYVETLTINFFINHRRV